MAVYHLLIMLSLTLLIPTNSHNITSILDDFPQYSVYNSFLSQTKVCDEINSYQTVTCLVLSNSLMSSLASKHSLAGIKNALRLLILLNYFDPQKLHDQTRGTTVLTPTLYQTTGDAPFNLRLVNISSLRSGKIGFASARPGSAYDATYIKSVMQIPYNLSVLEISAPITFPGLMDPPFAAPFNLTDLLEKAGCKIFASLITSSGVLDTYQSAMDKGFTLFAPSDDAFKADGVPDLTKLSRTDLVTVLRYHALPSYTPKASLKTAKGPVATMASNGLGMYILWVTSRGYDVSLDTGIGTSRIASSVFDDTTMCILTVERLLLPSEMFNAAAPMPAAPSSVALVPSQAPSTAPLPNVSWRRPRPPTPKPPQPLTRKPRTPPPPNGHGHDHSPPQPPTPKPRAPPPPNGHDSPPPPDPIWPPPTPIVPFIAPPPDAPAPDEPYPGPSDGTVSPVACMAFIFLLVFIIGSILDE
ncbi:Fasciclin-like arabinogalactan protein [Rhynchospora pubera]|uniref:Fasciclin-like arabinogalactan protein n=1 Tax=Rhynchospora pubera TaxID=906938 RepID=A0AAV8GBJ0_9POAL|nr:Fasciclin-like arabinogalactan protein [Rhynchospora pubera]